MRFFYAAPHLRNNVGHSVNYCRATKSGLKARGIETIVLASTYATEDVQRDLDAIPFFSMSGDWATDGDPVSGWLNAFDTGVSVTIDDFARLTDIRNDDVIYLNAVWPAQVMALGSWMKGLPPGRCPTAVVELVMGADVVLREDEHGVSFGFPDPRIQSRPLLYRFIAHKLLDGSLDRLHLATVDARCSEIYEALLGVDVHTLPWPYDAPTPQRQVRRDGVVIATLGYQRPKKGYQFMPEVATNILRRNRDARFLAHNSFPQDMPDVQQALRDIAAREPRLVLNEAPVTTEVWNALLDSADIVLCPYHTESYATCHSAVVAEALARGIPLVVPANTVLSAALKRFGQPGVTFDSFEAPAIENAINSALNQFDALSMRALTASEVWKTSQGPAHFVDAALRIAASSH